MNFSPSDFEGMKYPVHGCPPTQVFKKIPTLKILFDEAKEMTSDTKWEDAISGDALVRYMVYVYHRKSPLVEREADIVKRKKIALELCGIDLKKADKEKEWRDGIFSIIYCKSDFCNHLSLLFLKLENNIKWMQLVRAMEAYEDSQYQLQKDSDGTDKKSAVEIAEKKTKLYLGAKLYLKDVERLSNEIMQEDMALLNALQGHLFIERVKKRLITPEDYASMTPEERGEEFLERGLVVA